MAKGDRRRPESGRRRRETTKIWSDHPAAERAEEYLRRATEAARKAGCDREGSREDMINLARQWRELADLALQLARAEAKSL